MAKTPNKKETSSAEPLATLEDALVVIKEQSETLKEQDAIIADLTEKLEESLERASVVAREFSEAKALLSSTIKEQNEIIADLTEKHELKSAEKTNGLPVIKHKGKQYQVKAAKFNLDGVVYSHEDLSSDEKLVSRLIESEAGVIEQI